MSNAYGPLLPGGAQVQSATTNFPTVESTATTAGSTASTSPSVNLPDNLAADDLVIILFRTADGSSGVTWPGSPAWTSLASSTADSSDDQTDVRYRYITGTEGWGGTGNSITLTTASAKYAAIAYRISGAEDPATQAPVISTAATGTTTTPNPTAVTISTEKDYLFIWAGGWEGNQTSPPGGTLPTDYDNEVGASAGAPGTSTQRVTPDGTVFSLTNLSGAYTDVDDDPDSPDTDPETWLTTSNDNADTELRCSFGTVGGGSETITTGADVQNFRVRVRKFDGTGTPTVRIELRETGGGTALAQTSEIDVTSATGQVEQLQWNATLLSDADGSEVECLVYGTKSGGSPAARATVEIDAVEWNATYDDAVTSVCRVATCHKSETRSTNEDPGSWTISASDDWTAWVIAVHPAGGVLRDIAGTAAGTGGQSGDVSVDRPIDGSAAGTGGSTAALDTKRPIDGSAAGTSGSTASLGIKRGAESTSRGYSAPGEVSTVELQWFATSTDLESWSPATSFAPSAGDLLVLFTWTRGTALDPGVSDDEYPGFTWSKRGSTATAGNARVCCFVADQLVTTETGSHSFTFDFTGDDFTLMGYKVLALRGGAARAGAAGVRQTVAATVTTGNTVETVFSGAANGENPVLSAIALPQGTDDLTEPGTENWSLLENQGLAGPTTRVYLASWSPQATADLPAFKGTDVTWTNTASVDAAVLSVEFNTVANDAAVDRGLVGTAAGTGGASGSLSLNPMALAGTAAGTGGSTPSLDTKRPIDGTAAGVGGQSAALARTRPVDGSAAGTSGQTGDASVGRRLDATAAGTGGQAADASVDRGLVATAAGVGGQAADASVDRSLVGTAGGVGGSVADLRVIVPIEGTAAGTSGQTASLDVDRSITGSVAGTGASASDVSVDRGLNATAAGVGGQSGDTSVDRPLVGTAAGVGGSVADLDVASEVPLEGTASGTSGHAADLRADRPIDGTAAGTGGQAASLSQDRPIDATAAATSGQSGDLSASRPIDASAAGSASESADASVGRGLQATAAGVSGETADASVDRSLVASAGGVGGSVADLRVQGQVPIEGTAAGTSGETAALSSSRPIVGLASGSGGQTASLDRRRGIAATAAASSGQSADLATGRGLDATAGGSAGQSADASVQRGVVVSISAVSGATADLTTTRPGHEPGEGILIRAPGLPTIEAAPRGSVRASGRRNLEAA